MTITKRNGKYYCRFQVNGERHHYLCKGATDLPTAKSMESMYLVAVEKQQYGVIPSTPKNIKITLTKLLNLYKEYNKVNNRQREPKEKVNAFNEFFGKVDAVKIKPKDIEQLRKWLKEKKNLSASTINRYISCLSKAYNLGIDSGYLESNPCSKVKLLKEPKEKIKFYTKEEEELLFQGLKQYRPDFIPFVVCAFNTGLRVSNIQYLKWEQVDLKNRIIQIQPQDNKGSKLIRLYISDTLYKTLKSLTREGEYVFINPETKGVYLTPNRILKKICEKVGIKHIGFHGIRHTVGTRLTQQGTPINVVQAVLAHTDIRTTMKYVHLQDGSIKDAIQGLVSYN